MSLVSVKTSACAEYKVVLLSSVSSDVCPDDGAYKVLETSEGGAGDINVIIEGTQVIFLDGNGIQEIKEFEDLNLSYVLEPCGCTIAFD